MFVAGKTTRRRRLVVRCVGISLACSITGLSTAQAQISGFAPPKINFDDGNGVNLITLLTSFRVDDVAIGQGAGQLAHTVVSPSSSFAFMGSWNDNFIGGLNDQANLSCRGWSAGTSHSVSASGSTECFYLANGVFKDEAARGSRFAVNTDGTYLYTLGNGTKITIDPAVTLLGAVGGLGVVKTILTPQGVKTTLHYAMAMRNGFPVHRLRRVTNNLGYGFEYQYITDNTSDINSWVKASNIVGYNAAYQYCESSLANCNLSADWPRASYSYSSSGNVDTFSVTDAGGQVSRFTMDKNKDVYGRVTSVKLPYSASEDNVTYEYCGKQGSLTCTTYGAFTLQNGRITFESHTVRDMVISSVRDGATWNYGANLGVGSGGYESRTSHTPSGPFRESLMGGGGLIYVTDGLGGKYNFSADQRARLTSYAAAEGNITTYSYDARGNLKKSSAAPKLGSDLPPVEIEADYSLSCDNIFTCNQPNWIKDTGRKTTSYKYASDHGGITSITSPPVDGVSRVHRFEYAQRRAWILGPGGSYVQSPDPVWLLVRERYCRTGATNALETGCVVAGEEVVKAYDFGPDAGPSNLLLKGVVVDEGGLSLRTCYSYDKFGNRISETKPSAALASCS